MKEFPTCLGIVDKDNDNDDFIKKYKSYYNKREYKKIFELDEYRNKIINLEIDKENRSDYKNYIYDKEVIYGGVVNNFDGWRRIIKHIGQEQMGKFNFNSNLLSDTPVVITQHALNFEILKTQVKQIYEVLFEEFKCPYVLICSQAMLNLFSYNLSSGMVVDIGESGCHISTVLNGFTQYNETIQSLFLSGRNLTGLYSLYNRRDKTYQDARRVDLMSYMDAKFMREENNGTVSLEHLNNFYSYPEYFRLLYRKNFVNCIEGKDKNILSFGEDIKADFEKLETKDYEREINYHTALQKSVINQYDQQTQETCEKLTLMGDQNFINREDYVKGRQLSLAHILISKMENLITNDSLNSLSYLNVCFSGGVLNNLTIANKIKSDIYRLFLKGASGEHPLLYFKNDMDSSQSFYKGANYLSKIDNLQNIMISRKDYHDCGADKLCFNYI